MMKPLFAAISAVSLITFTLLHAFGLAENTAHLSFVPVWLLFMLVMGLPLALMESIIIRRTQQLPLQGIVSMTRDADAKSLWRLVIPLSLATLILVIGQAAQHAKHHIVWTDQVVLKESLSYLLVFLAAGFAWVGMRRLLAFMGVLVPIALAICAVSGKGFGQITLLTPEQWQLVASSTLLATTLGLGTCAWLIAPQAKTEKSSTLIMPLWLTQTVVGALTLMVGQIALNIYTAIYMACAVFAVAVCMETISSQLQAKAWSKPIALGAVLLAAILASYGAEYVTYGFVVKGAVLLTVIAYCVLMGWVMKISHVRKALNFNSEALYNIWRVFVRLVVPLTCVWLLVSMVL